MYHCTIDLLFDWFGLVCFAKKKFSGDTADSKPVKQEVNGTVILPPFSIPWQMSRYLFGKTKTGTPTEGILQRLDKSKKKV
jgi:hypothetical protein